MIKNKILKLKKYFAKYKIDGYVIPKNDEFFSEFDQFDRLKKISNFSGSAGLAIITKNQNFLFVDGRYTIQAKNQAGKNFKILELILALLEEQPNFLKNTINILFQHQTNGCLLWYRPPLH